MRVRQVWWLGVLALAGCTMGGGGAGSSGDDDDGPDGPGTGDPADPEPTVPTGDTPTGLEDPGTPCRPGGFCLEYPPLVGAELRAVHGADELEVWGVGAEGTALRTADGGETYARVATGTSAHLNGVFTVGPDAAWAVGDGGTLLQFDGTGWSAVEVPTVADLRDVAVDAEGTVWAVGGDETLGIVVSGLPGSFVVHEVPDCRVLTSIALLPDGEPVVGGSGWGVACVAVRQGGTFAAEVVDPHPHDPSSHIVSLLYHGRLHAVVDGVNTTHVAETDGRSWSMIFEPLGFYDDVTDIAPRAGGGLWVSGTRITATEGDACSASTLSPTRAIWSTPAGVPFAVGGSGLAARIDPDTGCPSSQTSYVPTASLSSQPRYPFDLIDVDATGTLWFLTGSAVWEYRADRDPSDDQGWAQAFEIPITFRGDGLSYVQRLAVCGDGEVRLVAHYYVGDDLYGPVYRPVAYRWERGMGAPTIDDVVVSIGTGRDAKQLDRVYCDGGEDVWFSYAGGSSSYVDFWPGSAVLQAPAGEPPCSGSQGYDTPPTLGGSPFLRTGFYSVRDAPVTYHDDALLAFDGEACRALTTADWPTLPGYIVEGEDGALQFTSELVGSRGPDEVWLASTDAIAAAVPDGVLELAHLAQGAWDVVRIPLPADAAADLSAALFFSNMSVSSVGDEVLVRIAGEQHSWVLRSDGVSTDVVWSAGRYDPLWHYADEQQLTTFDAPGTVHVKPL
jgi:hypothetical protein